MKIEQKGDLCECEGTHFVQKGTFNSRFEFNFLPEFFQSTKAFFGIGNGEHRIEKANVGKPVLYEWHP